jgi:hypothetical protein
VRVKKGAGHRPYNELPEVQVKGVHGLSGARRLIFLIFSPVKAELVAISVFRPSLQQAFLNEVKSQTANRTKTSLPGPWSLRARARG